MGPSDEALIPIIDWLLENISPQLQFGGEVADLRRLRRPPKTLEDRLTKAIELFPCDVLFVHRDAENQQPSDRRSEIQAAASQVSSIGKYVPVIPVRMTEAWLLSDERAIRYAAGNPNGITLLQLPPIARLEYLPNPKQTLGGLVSQAAGASTRVHHRQRRLLTTSTWTRIAEETATFANLQALPAFAQLQTDVREALAAFDAE